MKKFIITCFVIIISFFLYQYLSLNLGFYIDFNPDEPVTTFLKTDNMSIYIDKGKGYEELIIKGVELDSAIPGYFSTDYKADEKTYLRWLELIAGMGANTIRVNQVMDDIFYNTFYEFNKNREEPLYLLQSIWVTDYAQNSHNSAYSREFFQTLKDNCRTAVDVIHGNRSISLGRTSGSGNYKKDVSPWTLGYIVGTTWFSYTIAYTDDKDYQKINYSGQYIYTANNSSAFENLLAEVLDGIMSYESKKYKQQRLVSFISEPSTDPFEYLYNINIQIDKIAKIDANNIKLTPKVVSGFFASYRMYSYFANFSDSLADTEKTRLGKHLKQIDKSTIYDGYIHMLNHYHTYPVLVTSYGFSSSRGIENNDVGRLTEYQQGETLAETYSHMISVGCCGAIISSWQDVWSQRTWNTLHSVELTKAIYWSDYQTVDQFYGLMTFDPGIDESVCYVDGDISEWNENNIVVNNSNISLSMKYDEKFIYFLVNKKDFSENDIILIPVDTTPKTGSNYCEEYNSEFQRQSDFLIVLNGRNNSRVLVQQRYDVTRAMHEKSITGIEPYVEVPNKTTPVFNKMRLILKKQYDPAINIEILTEQELFKLNLYKTFETGKLTYGNANPKSKEFNSLSDFIFRNDYIEIRIPWQLFNFSDPSEMIIHDDYYENYGVENIGIKEMYVGVGTTNSIFKYIPMEKFPLKGWGNNVTYHERLKQSYYIIKKLWN